MTCLKLKIHSKILTSSPATTEPLEISKTVPSTWKLQQARTIFNKFHSSDTHSSDKRLCFNCTISRLYTIYLALCRVANVLQSRTPVRVPPTHPSSLLKGIWLRNVSRFLPTFGMERASGATFCASPSFFFFFSRIMHTQKRSLINYVATPTDLLSPLERLSKFVKRLIYFFSCSFWGIENGCFLKFEAIWIMFPIYFTW